MKLRQAKKILFGKHWDKLYNSLRPSYYDSSGSLVFPSFHDLPLPRYQKARRRYFGAAEKFKRTHGHCFDEK